MTEAVKDIPAVPMELSCPECGELQTVSLIYDDMYENSPVAGIMASLGGFKPPKAYCFKSRQTCSACGERFVSMVQVAGTIKNNEGEAVDEEIGAMVFGS